MIRLLARFGRFIRDRLIYAAAFVLCAACLVAVVALDQPGLTAGSTVYLFILSAAFPLGALAVDFFRQSAFLKQLDKLEQMPDRPPEWLFNLPEGVTREQRLFRRILLSQYRAGFDSLEEYRKTEERRHLFTNQWVHQMKTPVSVIDLLLQQAEQAEPGAHSEGLLTSIREENERISRGLDLVLHQARLEKFEGDLQIRSLDIRELARAVVNEHKKSLIRAFIFPQVTGDAAYVETDEKWMFFVLGQLVSNAVKYSRIKPGSKRLGISVERTPGGGCDVRVSDEGIGIPPQDLDRVFHPYFTGENGRRTGESTGMGLYLAREACRRLGHRLGIESTEGAGTTVTIRFAGSAIHDSLTKDA